MIQTDEKIVLGGYSNNMTDANFALARYNVAMVSVRSDELIPD